MSFQVRPINRSIDRSIEGNVLNTLLRVSSLLRFERDSWAGKG
jgi:hypothetical protein